MEKRILAHGGDIFDRAVFSELGQKTGLLVFVGSFSGALWSKLQAVQLIFWPVGCVKLHYDLEISYSEQGKFQTDRNF